MRTQGKRGEHFKKSLLSPRPSNPTLFDYSAARRGRVAVFRVGSRTMDDFAGNTICYRIYISQKDLYLIFNIILFKLLFINIRT
jgi:hypothetical protein